MSETHIEKRLMDLAMCAPTDDEYEFLMWARTELRSRRLRMEEPEAYISPVRRDRIQELRERAEMAKREADWGMALVLTEFADILEQRQKEKAA